MPKRLVPDGPSGSRSSSDEGSMLSLDLQCMLGGVQSEDGFPRSPDVHIDLCAHWSGSTPADGYCCGLLHEFVQQDKLRALLSRLSENDETVTVDLILHSRLTI